MNIHFIVLHYFKYIVLYRRIAIRLDIPLNILLYVYFTGKSMQIGWRRKDQWDENRSKVDVFLEI